MPVAVPPRRTQLLFWGTGLRLAEHYRPWVAEQIGRDDYARRRLRLTMAVQLVLVVIPQTLLALGAHSWLHLTLPVTLAVIYTVYAVSGQPMRESTRRRLLAYHGVTADGRLTEPVSAWSDNPLGRVGLALLSAQVLLFSSGVAVVADHVAAQRGCHVLTMQDASALAAVIGVPVPGAASAFAPAPIAPVGTPLIAARAVEAGYGGIRFVAAYARDSAGQRVGPAVWRIIDPAVFLNPSSVPDIAAQDLLARELTPSTSYGGSSPEDPALRKARNCARAAV